MTHTKTETLEERYNRYLREALTIGKRIQEGDHAATRSHAVSVTELETAILWSSKDMAEKQQI